MPRWPGWRRRSARICCRRAAPGTRSGSTARSIAGGEEEDEPIYGRTYMPRKFKIAVALPPHNDVDVFAHDLGFIAIEQDGRIVGYNVVVGGGMGMTHGEPDTFPRTGDVIGFCTPDQAVDVAEKVVTVQRDFGDRSDRKHARLKYTIERMGLDAFRAELERRLGLCAGAGARLRVHRQRRSARLGRGRRRRLALHAVRRERPRARSCDGLHAIAELGIGRFIITPNQNLVLADIPAGRARRRSRRCCDRMGSTRRSAGCGATRWPASRCRPAVSRWRRASATCRTWSRGWKTNWSAWAWRRTTSPSA